MNEVILTKYGSIPSSSSTWVEFRMGRRNWKCLDLDFVSPFVFFFPMTDNRTYFGSPDWYYVLPGCRWYLDMDICTQSYVSLLFLVVIRSKFRPSQPYWQMLAIYFCSFFNFFNTEFEENPPWNFDPCPLKHPFKWCVPWMDHPTIVSHNTLSPTHSRRKIHTAKNHPTHNRLLYATMRKFALRRSASSP